MSARKIWKSENLELVFISTSGEGQVSQFGYFLFQFPVIKSFSRSETPPLSHFYYALSLFFFRVTVSNVCSFKDVTRIRFSFRILERKKYQNFHFLFFHSFFWKNHFTFKFSKFLVVVTVHRMFIFTLKHNLGAKIIP